MSNTGDDVSLQRDYFSRVADEYDTRIQDEFEHVFALGWLNGALDGLQASSVLDIGSGTGRALAFLREKRPALRLLGIEPVEALRRIGYAKGIPENELIDGDALHLPFADKAFDVVCEFGVLHHIREPAVAVGEMLRVARRAIFISDSNNFGQGRTLTRIAKQLVNAVGAWRALDFVKTRGKGYTFAGDGVAYSYSVFNNYDQIASVCRSVHVLNTDADSWGIDPYRTSGHVALLGILR